MSGIPEWTGLRALVSAPGRAHELPAPTGGTRTGEGRNPGVSECRVNTESVSEGRPMIDRASSEFRSYLELYEKAPLLELAALADERRETLHPDDVVTYIVDRNINYTNVCVP